MKQKIYRNLLRLLTCSTPFLLSNSIALSERVKQEEVVEDQRQYQESSKDMRGLEGCVGNTPLVYLHSLSQLTGCHIYGKCEFMNPTGSVKGYFSSFLFSLHSDDISLILLFFLIIKIMTATIILTIFRSCSSLYS